MRLPLDRPPAASPSMPAVSASAAMIMLIAFTVAASIMRVLPSLEIEAMYPLSFDETARFTTHTQYLVRNMKPLMVLAAGALLAASLSPLRSARPSRHWPMYSRCLRPQCRRFKIICATRARTMGSRRRRMGPR